MQSTSQDLEKTDLRGKMFRAKRQMSEGDAQEFLRRQTTAHVATVGANGWPYVGPSRVYLRGR